MWCIFVIFHSYKATESTNTLARFIELAATLGPVVQSLISANPGLTP